MAAADHHGDAFSVLQQAINGQMSASKLSQELSALGAYRHAGRANPVAAFSAMICDALPRSWPGAAVGEQLGEKASAHQLLLQCLQDSGSLAELHSSALRLLFEDGQKLAALSELRELLAKGGAPPLQAVVLAAGAAAAAAAAPVVAAAPEDAFFACPLKSVAPLFLQEVAAAAARLTAQPGRAAGDQAALAQLARAVQAALGGALHQRAQHQQWFTTAFKVAAGGFDGQPEWTAGEGVRAALAALAESACRLHASLPAALRAENAQLVLELTDRLLNSWAAAVAAAAALPSAQRAELRGGYSAAKGRLLGWLLTQAQAQGLSEPDGEHLLRRVEGLAEAHLAFSQLYDIARVTGDRDTLYRQMEQLEGAHEGALAHFVFGRLLGGGHAAELMDLPSQFDAALHAWLSDAAAEDAPARQRLLWLHEVRCQEFGAAAGSLGALVAAQGAELGEEEVERLLAMEKLAALAAV